MIEFRKNVETKYEMSSMDDFYTEYMAIDEEHNKPIIPKFKREWCFSGIFQLGMYKFYRNTYKIKLFKKYKKYRNNFCPLSTESIQRHLRTLKTYGDIKTRICNRKDYIIIKMTVSGKLLLHKFALSWVRYLYEFPFNAALIEAYNLYDYKVCSGSIVNIINFVLFLVNTYRHGTQVHGICSSHWTYSPVNKKDILNKIEHSTNKTYLDTLGLKLLNWDDNMIDETTKFPIPKYDPETENSPMFDLRFWLDTKSRIPYYKEMIEKFKLNKSLTKIQDGKKSK